MSFKKTQSNENRHSKCGMRFQCLKKRLKLQMVNFDSANQGSGVSALQHLNNDVFKNKK